MDKNEFATGGIIKEINQFIKDSRDIANAKYNKAFYDLVKKGK